jgi:hypothetical protein
LIILGPECLYIVTLDQWEPKSQYFDGFRQNDAGLVAAYVIGYCLQVTDKQKKHGCNISYSIVITSHIIICFTEAGAETYLKLNGD